MPASSAYAVLSLSNNVDVSESDLLECSKKDMPVGMWESISNANHRFHGSPEGAELGCLIRSYYYQSMGISIPLFSNAPPLNDALEPVYKLQTEWGIVTCRRAPENRDRESDVNREHMKATMKKEGYDPTKRSPPMVMRVPVAQRWNDSEHNYWLFGAASCL